LGPVAATVNLTNTVVLIATGPRGEATSNSSAHVWVAPQLTLAVTKTVGTRPSECATTTQITVTTGTLAHYCIRIRNTGNRTLSDIVFTDPQLGVTGTFTNLLPGKARVFSSGQIRGLGPIEVGANMTNTVFVTATMAEGAVTTQATATVSLNPVIPAPAFIVTKTIAGTGDGACGNSNQYDVPPGSAIYYCFTIYNAGNTSFRYFTFQDPALHWYNGVISLTDFSLTPGEQISVTNQTQGLANLGPITPTFSITNTVIMTGFGSLGVATAQAQAVASMALRPDRDTDHDGIADSVEGETDMDSDHLPNYLDPDSDGDRALDSLEGVLDRNQNGVPDFIDPTIAFGLVYIHLPIIR
jgi:hypothetical protein